MWRIWRHHFESVKQKRLRCVVKVGGKKPAAHSSTNQQSMEPQVHFVVFVEPCSILAKPPAGEEYNSIICEGNEDEEGQGSRHDPVKK